MPVASRFDLTLEMLRRLADEIAEGALEPGEASLLRPWVRRLMNEIERVTCPDAHDLPCALEIEAAPERWSMAEY